ncbi:ABC transporter substrate-binding protein [Puniceibacterium sp. IMCC21224]|uniref:ABC transporter substrate-binding protein n=1 Tax=Puniceibacterium sp. IMCC21224 TaxID=1618204 RepID=UPI00064DD501|nr:ABC transporter substrate-binding protein [Puniceibacterium sp. IMCC21224]KMK65154.1 ABC-type nitrate/sulfonate/bicarbonate transport system, periplasmic component [Puniceibacterium sp. IMCC21224]
MTQIFNRRRFLRTASLTGLGLAVGGLAAPYIARAAATQIAIATNPGLENRTLNALMAQQGFLGKFGADTVIVDAPGATGPFDTIASGAADLCMVSGYNMVLPRIEQGAKLKIVGAGMKKTALTVFAKPEGIATLADLRGKTIAVGGDLGLLHALMLQLLKENGIDPTEVTFVNKGSNDNCYKAVVDGSADACCSSVSHLNDSDGLDVVQQGNMWEALPHYTFQTAYASDEAIRDKHEGLVAVMAAFGALYEYLMTPEARDAFFEARKAAQKDFDEPSAQAIWDYNQNQRPYSGDLSISDTDIDYLQDMFVGLGSLKQKQPIAAVADMSAAREAAKHFG